MNDNKHQNGVGDIDDLLAELKETKDLTTNLPRPYMETSMPDIDAESINKFVMEKAALVVQQGIDALERSKLQVQTTGNNEDIDAYTKLLQATTGAIDALNKVNLQDKKAATAKKLKEMDIQARKELPLPTGGHTTNNILVASREDIMKKLFDDAEEKVISDDVSEAEYTEVDHGASADK